MTGWSVRIDKCVVDGAVLIPHRGVDDSGVFTYYTCAAALDSTEHSYNAHYDDAGPFPVYRCEPYHDGEPLPVYRCDST